MLHAVDFGEYRIDDPEIKKYLKQSLREHHKVIKRVSKRSECSFDFLCYLSRQEKVLGAQVALKYGLIDRIERIYP
jgi:ATP-dependent protease ClpP protease subunit